MRRSGLHNDGCGALGVVWAISLAGSVACVAAPAWAQYEINWYTVDGGGAMRTMGGSYSLGGTIGQPDVGLMAGGSYSLSGGFWVAANGVVGVGIGDDDRKPDGLPLSFRLHTAVPNPLARRTLIGFDLPQARSVRVLLYDAAGRLVRTIADGPFPAGRHQRVWDANDDGGHPVATGIYFVRFEAETYRAREKIVVLR